MLEPPGVGLGDPAREFGRGREADLVPQDPRVGLEEGRLIRWRRPRPVAHEVRDDGIV